VKKIKTDFSRRDEFDRVPVPDGHYIRLGQTVTLFDEDLEVRASVTSNKAAHLLQIHWDTVRFASFKTPPPEEIRKEYVAHPMSTRRAWPM
jgi:hypothetical protein